MNNKKSMKIIQYNHSFHPILDGSSNYIKDIVSSIQDCEFEVITTGLFGFPSIEKISNNTIVRRFHPKDVLKLAGKSPLRYLLYPFGLVIEWVRLWKEYRYMKNSKYDILHIHSIDASISWLLCNKFRTFVFMDVVFRIMRFDKIQKHKLLTIHGLPMNSNPLFDLQIKKLFDFFTNIVCVDRNIVQYFEKLNSDKTNNILYIPNSVDVKRFKFCEKNRDKDNITVGFIGRLEYSRGIDIIIDLINRLPQHITLIIIGAGNKLAIDNFKKRIDISKIEFYSNVPNDKIPEYIKMFDVLLNPVLVEGISRITLESMSCGCPVIMINKGDRYPLIHDTTGFLVESNVEDVLNIFSYINADMNKLNEMGLAARKIIESEFSMTIFSKRYIELYNTLVESND